MNLMVVFLFTCIVLGLWSKPKTKLAPVVLALAVVLVLIFFVSPHRM